MALACKIHITSMRRITICIQACSWLLMLTTLVACISCCTAGGGSAGAATVELATNEFVQATELVSNAGMACSQRSWAHQMKGL